MLCVNGCVTVLPPEKKRHRSWSLPGQHLYPIQIWRHRHLCPMPFVSQAHSVKVDSLDYCEYNQLFASSFLHSESTQDESLPAKTDKNDQFYGLFYKMPVVPKLSSQLYRFKGKWTDLKYRTRRKFNSEEKIRIILEGLKGEDSIAAICRREGIAPSLYYKWSKTFLQAGKRRLKGDTLREVNSDGVSEFRQENEQLKQLVAELSLKNRVLKKNLNGLE